MKRYANIDIFNDVTRPSNILSSKDLVPTKTHEDRFQTDIIIHGKTNFEKDNTIISSLNDEIVSLKEKMRFVTEKDEKIHKLQLEITSLKKDNIDNNRIKEENSKYRVENKKLRDDADNIRIQLTRLHSLESENSNLKSKSITFCGINSFNSSINFLLNCIISLLFDHEPLYQSFWILLVSLLFVYL